MSPSNTRRRLVVDGCGLLLFVLLLGAVLLAERNGGDPWPLVELMVASLASLIVGRVAGLAHRALIPAAVAVTAGILVLSSRSVMGGGPLSGPFGYRNATGAFYVQATAAALMVVVAVRSRLVRLVGVATAVPFAVIAVKDSSAATVSLLAVALAIGLIASGRARGARVSVGVSAGVFVLVLAATITLGAIYTPGADGMLARALTERRLVLWHESLDIIGQDPGGVGPGRFQEVDPTALSDRDARWAHNEFLQQGVELGIVGLALMCLLVLWGFARLWVHPAPDATVALGAASLAALGIHASVDYVLHFPAVLLAAVALVGTAQAVPLRRFQRDRDDPRQTGLEGDAHPAGVAGAPAAG